MGAVWLLFKVLSCLESSGRVVGFISAHFRVYTTEMDRVMTEIDRININNINYLKVYREAENI